MTTKDTLRRDCVVCAWLVVVNAVVWVLLRIVGV